MKLQVQPGRRPGAKKTLFDRPLSENDVKVTEEGAVVVRFIADDIYTSKSTQQFSITVSPSEIRMIRSTLRIHMMDGA